MKHRFFPVLLSGLLCLSLVLSACGKSASTPTPSPSDSSVPETSAPSVDPSTDPTPDVEDTSAPSEPSAEGVVASVWAEISKLELPAMEAVDAETLTALYNIDSADLVDYVCQISMMNVHATEFFIAEVQDGKMDTVKAALEQRQDNLEEQWAHYLPEQLELVENYQLVVNGNYILFAINSQAQEIAELFNDYTK